MLQFTITFRNKIICSVSEEEICLSLLKKKTNKENKIMTMYHLGQFEKYQWIVWTPDDYILILLWHDNATKDNRKTKDTMLCCEYFPNKSNQGNKLNDQQTMSRKLKFSGEHKPCTVYCCSWLTISYLVDVTSLEIQRQSCYVLALSIPYCIWRLS